MLVELLLDQLASDYAANRADVPLVARLIHSREQQIELLRIDAAGLDKPDNRLNAWDAYLRLADFTAEEPAYLQIDDQYTVRSDRWISSRLAAIWSGGVGRTAKNTCQQNRGAPAVAVEFINRGRTASLPGTPRRASRGRRRATRACEFPRRARSTPRKQKSNCCS